MAFRNKHHDDTGSTTVTGDDRRVGRDTTVPAQGQQGHVTQGQDTRQEPVVHERHRGHHEARERFGGTNWGAAFFGWLVAVAMTILLVSIAGAVLTAVGSSQDVTQSEAERQAGTIGITAGIVLLAVLVIAYYTGGYVAGRMSRFDGGRQGLATWVIGLLVTLLAIGLGALFGNEYNLLDRVDLPRIPLSTEQLSTGGLVTAAAVLVGSLLAAMLGGKVGHRYHDKVDRVAHP